MTEFAKRSKNQAVDKDRPDDGNEYDWCMMIMNLLRKKLKSLDQDASLGVVDDAMVLSKVTAFTQSDL
jgi:hypothetical protein